MIAKLIAHGNNRQDAIQKLLKAIQDYKIEGVKPPCHSAHLCLIMRPLPTRNFDTKFVENYFHPKNKPR
ncbi:MAG: hypothetical protein R2807_09230 [Chitinophagales bacterium]